MLDVENDVALVKGVVVDAVVCDGDEIDEIEDVVSLVFDVAELRAAADVSLSTNSLLTSSAVAKAMKTSKRNNIREACLRASMMSKVCDRSHKLWRCLE